MRTTVAPILSAVSAEPSVLPESTITISTRRNPFCSLVRAISSASSVPASFTGTTTDTVTSSDRRVSGQGRGG